MLGKTRYETGAKLRGVSDVGQGHCHDVNKLGLSTSADATLYTSRFSNLRSKQLSV
jgi:hypothetical protein